MRRLIVLTVTCLALAAGIPLAWWATRPEPAAGPGVVSVLAREPGTPGVAVTPSRPRVSARPAAPVPATRRPGPVLVRLDRLGIRARVVPVGVREDGAMSIPDDVSRVGWYRFGPAPGASAGAVVLSGHVDSAEQGRGALFRLREARPGDLVEVRLDGGRSMGYRVVAKETIVKRRLPTERLFARTGAPRLVLITCGGPFLEELSSYRDNLVVVAEPVAGAAG